MWSVLAALLALAKGLSCLWDIDHCVYMMSIGGALLLVIRDGGLALLTDCAAQGAGRSRSAPEQSY